nr:M24 family metallopeptidase [Oscillospiraceae bacterium]
MICVKTERELEIMRKACKITAAARALAGEMVRPGVTTGEIDKAVHDFIVSQGAKPSFLNYQGYPGSACISVNERGFCTLRDDKVMNGFIDFTGRHAGPY